MQKMLKCKTCQAEIAKSAKTCPSCGAKNSSPIYAKWWVWAIAVIVVIGIANSGKNNATSTSSNNNTTNQAESKKTDNKAKTETIFNIGDVITTDKFEITIISVEERTKVGTQYFDSKPSYGGTYVAVK
jgi:RNA polymerase subunit RPABC4/transcription elongation factor Spt4